MKKTFNNAEQREAPELLKGNSICHVIIVDQKTNFSNNDQNEISESFSKKISCIAAVRNCVYEALNFDQKATRLTQECLDNS